MKLVLPRYLYFHFKSSDRQHYLYNSPNRRPLSMCHLFTSFPICTTAKANELSKTYISYKGLSSSLFTPTLHLLFLQGMQQFSTALCHGTAITMLFVKVLNQC